MNCKDCKHFRFVVNARPQEVCTFNYFKPIAKSRSAVVARSRFGACGIEAKFFEPTCI